MRTNQSLLIIGASARAASMSALKAGFEPIAVDIFGDRDLKSHSSFQKISCYPDDFVTIASQLQSKTSSKIPLVYTGALENYPDVLDDLEKYVRLHGNSAKTVKQVRDPFLLSKMLIQDGLPVIPFKRDVPSKELHNQDLKTRWLRKPFQSAGGNHIQFCNDNCDDYIDHKKYYYQQFVEGETVSASFISTDEGLFLLGITKQIDQKVLGMNEWPAGPFSYCGSYGPIRLRTEAEEQVLKIGESIVANFKLKGLFGIDLIDDGKSVRLLEVNPRYTASIEVLEHSFQKSFMQWHVKCFDNISDYHLEKGNEFPSQLYLTEPDQYVSKLIIYAENNLKFPSEIPLGLPMLEHAGFLKTNEIVIADVPQEGTIIEKGQPICTLLVSSGKLADSLMKSSAIINQFKVKLNEFCF